MEAPSLVGMPFYAKETGGSIASESETHIDVDAGADRLWRVEKHGLLVCRSPIYLMNPAVFSCPEIFVEIIEWMTDGLDKPVLHPEGALWRDENGETCLEPLAAFEEV